MRSAFNSVTSGCSLAIPFHVATKNPRLPLISSAHASPTAVVASTSAMAASFVTLGLVTDCAADRWRTFLSNISRTGAASGFDTTSHALIVAKWWQEHVRA